LGKATKPKPFAGLEDRYRKLALELSQLMDEWIKTLGLDYWSIETSYLARKCEHSENTRAEVSCSWEYRNAVVTFYLGASVEDSPDEREYSLVHELCHCLVNPMSRGANKTHHRKNEESVVTDLACAFIRLKRSKDGKY
jgi:hypothetical protein